MADDDITQRIDIVVLRNGDIQITGAINRPIVMRPHDTCDLRGLTAGHEIYLRNELYLPPPPPPLSRTQRWARRWARALRGTR